MTKKPQIDKFREKAREIGADENEGRFDETLRRVAKRRPRSVVSAKKKRR